MIEEELDEKGRIVGRNPHVKDYKQYLDAEKYRAIKKAMQQVLPDHSPGLSQNETRKLVAEIVDKTVFPGGEKVDWWSKSVQLDLEYRGILVREETKPLRWYFRKI